MCKKQKKVNVGEDMQQKKQKLVEALLTTTH